MSTSDLERELARRRGTGEDVPPSRAQRLSVADALAYRNAGNLPDEEGRSLRLVLHVDPADRLRSIDEKRRLFEPDYHDPPTWRGPDSKPVNVVPLRTSGDVAADEKPWWEQPELKELEEEWRSRGTVAGVAVPGAYRSFVYKTVLALGAAGRDITATAVADSVARWLPPDEAARLRAALLDAAERA